MGKKRNGYAIAREQWEVDWAALRTPLGLPGQRQAVCTRISYVALAEGLPPKPPDVRYYTTDLRPDQADAQRLRRMIRGHWSIENQLHHPKDRTWLEDRHWVKNKKTGAVVTMLRSLACCVVRRARPAGLNPKAFCPERIEYFNRSPQQAVALIKGAARL